CRVRDLPDGQRPREGGEKVNSPSLRIAIIGGGIGGLTLAIALRQRGVAAEVFEQAPELTEIGVAVGLAAQATPGLRGPGRQRDQGAAAPCRPRRNRRLLHGTDRADLPRLALPTPDRSLSGAP